jgi:Domain of unknown function (DUF5134)
MAGPSWLAGTFAAVMILIALFSAGRLAISRVRRRATELDADGLHVVMGVSMAGMLVPQLVLLPTSVGVAVFGAAAAWFGWHALRIGGQHPPGISRCRYPVPHLVECVAMLYMLLPVAGSRPANGGTGMMMAGMGAAGGQADGFPALAVVLALFMLGYLVWTTDRLTSAVRARTVAADPAADRAVNPDHRSQVIAPPVLAPRLAAFTKIAMSITMGYMLILMF